MAKLTPAELTHIRANPSSYGSPQTIIALVDRIYALESELEKTQPRIQDMDAD